MVDPARYRRGEDVEAARAADPIARFARALLAAGIADEDALAELEARARAEVDEAVAFADGEPAPGRLDAVRLHLRHAGAERVAPAAGRRPLPLISLPGERPCLS